MSCNVSRIVIGGGVLRFEWWRIFLEVDRLVELDDQNFGYVFGLYLYRRSVFPMSYRTDVRYPPESGGIPPSCSRRNDI
jgi:hypothetical protein